MSETGGVTQIASTAAAHRTNALHRPQDDKDRSLRPNHEPKPEQTRSPPPGRKLDIHA